MLEFFKEVIGRQSGKLRETFSNGAGYLLLELLIEVIKRLRKLLQ